MQRPTSAARAPLRRPTAGRALGVGQDSISAQAEITDAEVGHEQPQQQAVPLIEDTRVGHCHLHQAGHEPCGCTGIVEVLELGEQGVARPPSAAALPGAGR